ncbi:hypothetical protein K9857_11045 [Pseudomonas sp. REP124]|nr:hypothetical protein [Pseudomonas sp. REP124]
MSALARPWPSWKTTSVTTMQ